VSNGLRGVKEKPANRKRVCTLKIENL